ncbi:dynein regulatory complex protein 1-like [Uloborus diversus]|uniref:dynein regulatory complex protein 1-like n=1 Tax=Uloborus diversus TaxID=327109 RepID=UPI002409E937|nr:dynein regulatory complex protein 1-like [Uloborus diversus]
MEYEDCRKRVQKQLMLPSISEVEKFLSEVEETGEKEISHLRPLGMTVWHECTQELTSKDIRNAFLADQKEMTVHWQKAFEDLFMLSTELEKVRTNYYLTRSKLEKEVFWMEKDYKENMPKVTKMKRELTDQVSKRNRLKKELRYLKNQYDLEKNEQMKTQLKLYERITRTRQANKLAHDNAVKKCQNVMKMKKLEVEELLNELIDSDKLIHKDILNVKWEAPDTSFWENKELMKDISSDNLTFPQKFPSEVRSEEKRAKAGQVERKGSEIRIIQDDEFAESYRLLVSNGEFEAVLNEIATELGYMLDFKWVNYVKETLSLNHDVKWVEMFKVFRISFVEDLKELKDHMTSYCKRDENGELAFNSQGALDGFLHFVQSRSSSETSLDEPKLVVEEEYWNSVIKTMPNCLLWEAVSEGLEEYR